MQQRHARTHVTTGASSSPNSTAREREGSESASEGKRKGKDPVTTSGGSPVTAVISAGQLFVLQAHLLSAVSVVGADSGDVAVQPGARFTNKGTLERDETATQPGYEGSTPSVRVGDQNAKRPPSAAEERPRRAAQYGWDDF